MNYGMDEKLISIGEMSSLSGMSIKKLRYYYSIGILPPAQINQETGYRYYSISQLAIVTAIECCQEIGIPLKEMRTFLDVNNSSVDFKSLKEYGEIALEEKKRQLENSFHKIKYLHEEQERAEILRKNSDTVKLELPEVCYWIESYDGIVDYENYCIHISKLSKRLKDKQLKAELGSGLILFRKNSTWEKYWFSAIDSSELGKYPEIVFVPQGEYLCKRISEFSPKVYLDKQSEFANGNEIELIAVGKIEDEH